MGQSCVRTLGPRVMWCIWIEIPPDIAKLVDPSHQVPICIGVTCTFAAAHGDTHHIASFDFLHSCQCSDFAIIDDLERHISGQVLGNPLENVDHLGLVHIRRHVWEDVAPCCLVVSRHGACCAATDSVDLGQGLLCYLEAIH